MKKGKLLKFIMEEEERLKGLSEESSRAWLFSFSVFE